MFPELEKTLRQHFAPYEKNNENAQLFSTLLADLTEETKDKIDHGVPKQQALAEAIANLDELDVLLKNIHSKKNNVSDIDSSQLNRFYDRFFATKLVNSLTVNTNSLNQIILNYHTATIVVTQTEQPELTINEYMNHDRKSLYAQQHQDGDKVKIDQTARGGAFAFMRIRVEVKIPKSFSGFVYLNNKSGSVLIDNLHSHYILDCSTDNGAIIAHNLELAQLHIQAKSGSIRTAFLTADQIVLSSTSGSIQLIHSQGTTPTSMISTKARSGNIVLEHVNASEINSESHSGNITTNTMVAQKINLLDHSGVVKGRELSGAGQFRSTSGNVQLFFNKITDNITATSKSGSIKLGLPADSQYTFKMGTSNGGIIIPYDINLNAGSNRKQKTGQRGQQPTFNLVAKTGSGSIRID